MDDTNHALFSRFSAGLVATALKDTPAACFGAPILATVFPKYVLDCVRPGGGLRSLNRGDT